MCAADDDDGIETESMFLLSAARGRDSCGDRIVEECCGDLESITMIGAVENLYAVWKPRYEF